MLCWEPDPANCHRTMVAEYLRAAGFDFGELPTDFGPHQLALFQ
jgi:hypothetical protein